MSQQIHNRKVLKQKRKKLRNNLTPGEASLWKFLQKSQSEGRKFRRQHSVGNYILDFYCPGEKNNIELDGEYHIPEKDKKRDQYLNNLGITVLRFENRATFESLETVLEIIKSHFSKKKPQIKIYYQ